MRLLQIFVLVFLAGGAGAQQSQNVNLLCNWNDDSNITINTGGQRYNDVWGFVMNGKEYAAIGSTEGVHIIDVDACQQVAFYPGRDSGVTIIHRDYKTYQHYLYAVADEGMSTLQVFDLNYLPDSLHLVYESNPLSFLQAHNIFIDTSRATLYACSAKGILTGVDQMRVYSLADPENPVLLTQYNQNDKVHDVYVRNDTAYCSSGFYGFEVVDFTSHSAGWQNIGELRSYPFQGYNHSSWIGADGIGVMADETHGMPLKVIDARNLENIQVMSTFSPRPNDTTCIPHNPFLLGKYVFISYYMDGLQIYDISDPYNPVRKGYYDTYSGPDFKGYAGAWGCYPFLPSGRVLVSDMQGGLFVFDVSGAVKIQDTLFADRLLKVTPNPFSAAIEVSLPGKLQGTVTMKLQDMRGRVVWSSSRNVLGPNSPAFRQTLPADLPPTTYLLEVQNGKDVYHMKLIKQ